jgi:Flp pilus assembly protein TadG
MAVVEFACVAMMLITMVFGIIDFSRAIYEKQVITHLTREGSNLASRYTSSTNLSSAAQAVIDGSTPLDLNSNGYVIVTAVTNNGGACQISEQVSMGGKATTSRIGKPGDRELNLPQPCSTTGTGIPQLGQTVYATEVFYTYQPLTPVGSLLQIAMPTTLYDVAYF